MSKDALNVRYIKTLDIHHTTLAFLEVDFCINEILGVLKRALLTEKGPSNAFLNQALRLQRMIL